jgi:Protein of unknown function (DUF2690)
MKMKSGPQISVLSAALVGAAVAAILVVASVGATAQSNRCSSEGCRGKNPAQYTCVRDAKVLASEVVVGGWVQVFYSRSCNSAWARAVVRTSGGIVRVAENRAGAGLDPCELCQLDFDQSRQVGGDPAHTSVAGGFYYTWTDMVSGSNINCGHYDAPDTPTVTTRCF